MAVRRAGMEELLVRAGVDPAKMKEARKEAERSGVTLAEGAQRVNAVSADVVARSLAEMLGLPFRDVIELDTVDVELIRPISLAMAREEGILPLYHEGGFVRVAIAEERSMGLLPDLRLLYKKPVRPVVVPSDVLRDATNKTYDRAARSASAVMEEIREEGAGDDIADDLSLNEDLLDDPNQAPIIRFVNTLLTQAVKDRASDIHVEPFERELVVRFRIDGVLYEIVKPPPKLQASIVSRVKIMAGLNIAEKRIPQDGRIRTRFAGREIDLRVSTLPVRHGERVVMRILEKGTVFNLEQIGMAAQTVADFRKFIQRPHGILLVTGPTGSGKTTTLYSALAEINAPDLNILTIEDPIEFVFPDQKCVVNQREVGLDAPNFHQALRSALRQDPDVILIGEMRDLETVEIALHAAETGHLVLATLHTIDAHETINRLVGFFEPHQQAQIRLQLGSVLRAVLSQRLVPAVAGGRVAALEVMLNTGTVYECIVDGSRTREIRDHIRRGRAQYGMQTFDQALYDHITAGRVLHDNGLRFANNPDELALRLSGLMDEDD